MRISVVALLFIGTSAAHAAPAFLPGAWDITTQFEATYHAGTPRDQRPGDVMAKPVRQRICLTPEQTQRGALAVLGAAPDDCRYQKLAAKGGRMRVDMICRGDRPSPVSVSIAGTYSPDRFELETDMTHIWLGSRIRTKGAHIGSC
jgi:hypothetical protein